MGNTLKNEAVFEHVLQVIKDKQDDSVLIMFNQFLRNIINTNTQNNLPEHVVKIKLWLDDYIDTLDLKTPLINEHRIDVYNHGVIAIRWLYGWSVQHINSGKNTDESWHLDSFCKAVGFKQTSIEHFDGYFYVIFDVDFIKYALTKHNYV